jgi:hypothetical protein
MRSVLAEARFLGIIRAELRAEVLAIRGAPKFNSSVVRSERRVAVGATAGAVVDVSAARDHRIPPASRDVTHGRSNESLPADFIIPEEDEEKRVQATRGSKFRSCGYRAPKLCGFCHGPCFLKSRQSGERFFCFHVAQRQQRGR